jgi:predicted amidophosphoribosyltransferase
MLGWALLVVSGLSVSAVIGLLIGRMRGRGADGLCLGLLLGPIGWLLAALLRDLRFRCPRCLRPVPDTASRCVCGHDLFPPRRPDPRPATCSFCGAFLSRAGTVCPSCGSSR